LVAAADAEQDSGGQVNVTSPGFLPTNAAKLKAAFRIGERPEFHDTGNTERLSGVGHVLNLSHCHCRKSGITHNARDLVMGRSDYTISDNQILTNYVSIQPPSALISFGEADNASGGWIDTVANLAVFPKLQTLDLWEDNLLNLDLTGCQSLLNVRVAGNFESQTVTDTWLSQLAASTTNTYGTFFYNSPNVGCWAANHSISNPVTVGSAAYNTLTNLHWTNNPWCGQ
jgi:hypothetical protein